MKAQIAISVITLLTGISLFPVDYVEAPVTENQTLQVQDYDVSFVRGDFSIISYVYEKDYILSDKEIIDILRLVGFEGDELRMAWAIAVKESTLKPNAHNDNPSTGDNSYGLFQINMRGSMGPDRREKYNLASNDDLFNPLINATVAYKMSNGGQNWSAWSTKNQAIGLLSDFPAN